MLATQRRTPRFRDARKPEFQSVQPACDGGCGVRVVAEGDGFAHHAGVVVPVPKCSQCGIEAALGQKSGSWRHSEVADHESMEV